MSDANPRITRPTRSANDPAPPDIDEEVDPEVEEDDPDIDEVEVLPELLLHKGNLPAAVYELRDLLAADGKLFDRGDVLVALQNNATGALVTHALKVSNIVMRAHDVCQPMKSGKKGWDPETLPDRVARMYLEAGEWGVRPLAGITTAPLLRADGSIISARGYDAATQMYCDAPPAVSVPDNPTKAEAEAALRKLRETFYTFPFADSELVRRDDGIEVIDLDKSPGFAESSFLTALLTGVARPSLWVAPGVLIIAPSTNGAGSGKGLLARSITIVSYGIRPRAFVTGDAQEFEKRISAALMTGRAAALIDNVNGRMLKSETLSSALTERPAEVRIFGYLEMRTLNAVVLVILTGNGLRVTEDLTRRFLQINIDPRMEDPESRPFKDGFLNDITRRRIELLEYALTILRYGRQHAGELKRGRSLGSFEQWAEWVRDPLLALGCADPVEEMLAAKARDPKRQELGEIFTKWYERHGSEWVTADDLHDAVKYLIDPDNKGRQFIAAEVESYVNTRIAGYALTRRKNPAHRWVAAKYQLTKTAEAAAEPEADPQASPKSPKSPYWARREAEAARWREQWEREQADDNEEDPR